MAYTSRVTCLGEYYCTMTRHASVADARAQRVVLCTLAVVPVSSFYLVPAVQSTMKTYHKWALEASEKFKIKIILKLNLSNLILIRRHTRGLI